MISDDQVEEIQRLKARRFSQHRIARDLKISRSTVARHWDGRNKPPTDKPAPRKLDFDDLFLLAECSNCHIVYPNPKFMPAWSCPGCRKQNSWQQRCWYTKRQSFSKWGPMERSG